MREIKFRAWNVSDTGNTNTMIEWEEINDYTLPEIIEVYPETLMQYTGLKDKNGKEIYEGDIVKHEGVSKYKLVELSVDENKDFFLWRYINSIEELEVIGNIYENPELKKEIKGE